MVFRGFLTASATCLALLLILTSCDEPAPFASLDRERKAELERWAGLLARYWTLCEGTPGHPGDLPQASLDSFMDMCDEEPESWPYLYSCISDTIALLEPPDPSCQR